VTAERDGGEDFGHHVGQRHRRVDDRRSEAPVGRLEAGVPEQDVGEFFWCRAEPVGAGGHWFNAPVECLVPPAPARPIPLPEASRRRF
jgi:hypothetical protein